MYFQIQMKYVELYAQLQYIANAVVEDHHEER